MLFQVPESERTRTGPPVGGPAALADDHWHPVPGGREWRRVAAGGARDDMTDEDETLQTAMRVMA
jgi:hypothetical protein